MADRILEPIRRSDPFPTPVHPQDYDTEALRELDELIRPSNYPGCSYYERKFQIPWDEG